MPSHGKQEANNSLSAAYQTLLVERERLLEQRRKLLGEKAFIELDEKHQIEYCRLNKQLRENYWNGFETAKTDKTFELGAQDFQKALEMGFSKATDLFLEENANEEKHKAYILGQPDFITGLRFHLGLGYSQNQKEAVRYYRKAAEKGEAFAQFNLGVCYQYGKGVEKDGKEAVRWYRLAAEQGLAVAQCNLGVCYQNGIGVEKDAKEAVHWYRLPAEQGHAVAQNNLAFLYLYGIGVEKDEKESVRWCRLAAEQGPAVAQGNLAFYYYNGYGIEKDEKEALRWSRLAAEQGHASALQNLKTLTTPVARFTVALLEKDFTKAIELALSHEELESAFFTEELANLAQQLEDKNSVSSFLQTLQAQAQELNKNINASLITALLSLNAAISTHSIKNSDEIAFLMTELLDIVSIADAQASQVKELMHFFCNLYDDNTPEVILEPLITLWHRAQTLKVAMDDSGLNQLMASKIVSHLFENKYCLKFNPDFSKSDLEVFVFGYEKTPRLTAETLNILLDEPLLIDVAAAQSSISTEAGHPSHSTKAQSSSCARFFNRNGSPSADSDSGQTSLDSLALDGACTS